MGGGAGGGARGGEFGWGEEGAVPTDPPANAGGSGRGGRARGGSRAPPRFPGRGGASPADRAEAEEAEFVGRGQRCGRGGDRGRSVPCPAGGSSPPEAGQGFPPGEREREPDRPFTRSMARLDVTERFAGVRLPGHLHTPESLARARAFQFRPSDALLVTYPKSGEGCAGRAGVGGGARRPARAQPRGDGCAPRWLRPLKRRPARRSPAGPAGLGWAGALRVAGGRRAGEAHGQAPPGGARRRAPPREGERGPLGRAQLWAAGRKAEQRSPGGLCGGGAAPWKRSGSPANPPPPPLSSRGSSPLTPCRGPSV